MAEIVSKLIFPHAVSARRIKRTAAQSVETDVIDPSVSFVSFANTYGEMTSLSISQEITTAAAGFIDGAVRIFDLSDRDYSVAKPKQWNILPKAVSGASRFDGNCKSTFICFNLILWHLFNHRLAGGIVNPLESVTHSRSSSVQGGVFVANESAPKLELRGHSRPVYGTSLRRCDANSSASVENRLILSCSGDESIRLWDYKSGICVCRYSASAGAVWNVDFCPYGYYFVSCNQNNTASLYATDNISPIRFFVGHSSDVVCSFWHPNVVYVATGSDDRTSRLWDIRSARCARVFSADFLLNVNSVAMSPAGDVLAAGGDSSQIATWDIGTGRLIASLPGSKSVQKIAFNCSGSVLVSGAIDGSIRIWNLKNEDINTKVCSHSFGPDCGGVNSLMLPSFNTYYSKHCSVFDIQFASDDLVVAGGPFNADESLIAL
jgi:WD40 repeat protein